MNYEQNLFISYAHLDDQPLMPGEKGWVTRFHATLKALLSMRMGREAKIWRDEKLQGNDVFSNEIVAQFNQSAALLSVVTPRYLSSEWCTREAREFCQSAERSGGLAVGNQSRVFKVTKTPVDAEELGALPAHLKEIDGFDFFIEEDGALLELDPNYGPKFDENYRKKIGLLAQNIARLLKTLQAGEPPAPTKPTVYLAECGYDRKQDRELIEGELKCLGYPVLPDKRLPQDELEYVSAVESLLARCALSVHLVGEKYGTVPDGPTDKSASILQNELAVARCRSGGLQRLIWVPQGTRSGQAPQQAFIEALHQDADAQFGADLITGGVEELKAAIHATLKKIEEPEPKQPERDVTGEEADDGENTKLIYFIISNEADRKASVAVRKFCKQLGFDVRVPEFEGDASHIRHINQRLLASCDAVFLFYGAGDQSWKRAIDKELKKMPGYRAGKPLPAVYTYLAEPRTSDKEDLIDMEEPGLIDGLSGFAEAAVAKSVQAMIAAGATS
jgi:hypothetical protein